MMVKKNRNRHDLEEREHGMTLSAVDNDLAIENLENDFDMTAADLQDFREK